MPSITIKEFGIETELNVEGLSTSTKRELFSSSNNEYSPYNTISVCKDNEYYSTQIEYKMFPTSIGEVKPALMDWNSFISTKLSASHSLNGNDWVGTHIHFFLKREDGEELKMMYNVKLPIVHYMMKKLIIHFETNYNSSNSIWYRELERVCRSHSVWRYFDTEVMEDGLKNNMKMYGTNYRNFADGTSKKKYQPVLWSLRNEETGKPLSLELRMIPNTYLFFGNIEEDIKFIENSINNRISTTSDEYKRMKYEVQIMHMALCSMLIEPNTKSIQYVRKQFNF